MPPLWLLLLVGTGEEIVVNAEGSCSCRRVVSYLRLMRSIFTSVWMPSDFCTVSSPPYPSSPVAALASFGIKSSASSSHGNGGGSGLLGTYRRIDVERKCDVSAIAGTKV